MNKKVPAHVVAILRAVGVVALGAGFFYVGNDEPVGLRAQGRQTRSTSVHEARAVGAMLLQSYPELLDERSGSGIREALSEYARASRTVWLMGSTRTSLTHRQVQDGLRRADQLSGLAAERMAQALNQVPGIIRLSEASPRLVRTLSIPYGSAVLVLRRQRGPGSPPRFLRRDVDLASAAMIVDLEDAGDFFCVLEFLNPPPSGGRFQIGVVSSGVKVAEIDLTVAVPPKFPLRVDVLDAEGQATAAAVGLYSTERRFLVPTTALDFSSGGFNYQPVSYREHSNAKFWPGQEGFTRCFFVKGRFTMSLPEGSYRLIVSKGPEYKAEDRSIAVGPGRKDPQRIQLKRWINMSERGWHSGDTHIHYARRDNQANERLALWLQAEDLAIGNILRMGDARQTYFEQYAFGKAGRFLYHQGALIPGQEDPRTGVLGHTISLNMTDPIRDAERRYYLYSTTFDEVRRQGGLSGYAHVNTDSFLVHRDMTLNIPRNKVDFVEICEFGAVGTELYYEFLNLGFRLTAVGGSDAPWGGTVGDSRVYVYTGGPLDPERWFSALRAGRTFVTAGPMLELTVNGRLPGEVLDLRRGAMLKIRAKAEASGVVPLDRLEVVANDEVIRSAQAVNGSARLDLDVPAEKSNWIAARTIGAHTTPIYVTVDGKRHWNLPKALPLIEKRLRTLDEIEKLVANQGEDIESGQQPEWENRDAFRWGGEELRKMIAEARTEYLGLRQQATQER